MASKTNPNPGDITAPLWQFWYEFDNVEPTVLLGGMIAHKPGYHNRANRLKLPDYSWSLAVDTSGPKDKSRAIDLTMSTSAMIRYTTRLDKAARARDPRMFVNGTPIIREFIGTKDGKTVYCYVLTGGRALGVGADAGEDKGRDKSHLWHLHLSIIGMFVNTWQAYAQLLSVLAGETLATFSARTGTLKPVVVKPASGAVKRDAKGARIIAMPWPKGSPIFIVGVTNGTYPTVREWQLKMRSRGWSIAVTGKFRAADAAVLKAFQREKGLTTDGRLGPQSLAAAWSKPVTK